MRFDLLAFQFERVGHQASLWSPGLRTQPDLLGDLKSLQFCWSGERKESNISEYESDSYSGKLVQKSGTRQETVWPLNLVFSL